MPVGTKRPHLTPARALLVALMDQYVEGAYRLTLLEIQKLAYFLQLSGEKLHLRYKAGVYGPYADNLNKVLEILEGHFIRGLGDEPKPDRDIELLPGAADEAKSFLTTHVSSVESLKRVSEVIDGFETPYGMELLSSVHWVATHQQPTPSQLDEVVKGVHGWEWPKAQDVSSGSYRHWLEAPARDDYALAIEIDRTAVWYNAARN